VIRTTWLSKSPSFHAFAARWCDSAANSSFGARQVPALGYQLGADALRDEAVRVAVADAAADEILALGLRADRDAAHRLDPGSDDHVVRPGEHSLRGEVQCLLGRAALTVHGHPGDGFGEPRAEQRPARGVAGLLADLADRTTDDVVDVGRVDTDALDERGQRASVQVDRVDAGVRAARLALGNRSADGVDQVSGAHGRVLSQREAFWLWKTIVRSYTSDFGKVKLEVG